MAQRIQTLFIDDIDGGAADGTVRFGLDGADYEIDLSGEHSDELREALGKYIEHSRKVGAARRAARGRGAVHAIDTAKVREWARGTATTSRTAAGSPPISSRNTRRRPERNRSQGGRLFRVTSRAKTAGKS